MPPGTVSIDLDTERHHLEGYGFDVSESADGRLLQLSIKRWLDLLRARKIRATFFAIGENVAAHPDLFKRIVASGHELASHSMTHPQPFLKLANSELEAELTQSSRVILERTGKRAVGFRAPNFELNKDLVKILSKTGYLYDASLFPGPVAYIRNLYCMLKGNLPARGNQVGRFRMPRLMEENVIEFPLATMPALGFSFYSTFLFITGPAIFHSAYKISRTSFSFFSFVCHAIDMLSLDDGLDPRLASHPGMRLKTEEKGRRIGDFLSCLNEDFTLNPFEEHIGFVKRDAVNVHSGIQLLHG